MAATLLVLSCAEADPADELAGGRGHTVREREAAIHEAVIRAMALDEPVPGERALCIEVRFSDSPIARSDRVDADPGFLARFQGAAEVVAPGSECRLEEWPRVMRHSPTGANAVLYTVGAPVWRDSGAVEVRGGWRRGGLYGSSCTYDLAWRGDGWVVERCRDAIDN